MSIAEELTNFNTFLTNAYTKAEEKGATIPASKNLQNLESTIESITGGGGGTAAGREVTVEALEDINADSVFVGTKNTNFTQAVTSSSIGATFIALSQDSRVGIHAQTLNGTTATFQIWFKNENGMYDAVDFPINLTYAYPTMSTGTVKINQDGTLAVIWGDSTSIVNGNGSVLVIEIDFDTRAATFHEVKGFISTNIPTNTDTATSSSYTYVTTYGDTVTNLSYPFRLAGNELTFIQNVPFTKETITNSTGASTTSTGTVYSEANYKINSGSITRVKETIVATSPVRYYYNDVVHWINDTEYLLFPTTGNTSSDKQFIIYRYRKSSSADTLEATYTLTPTLSTFAQSWYRYCRFSANGQYAIITMWGSSTSNTTPLLYVYRLNHDTATGTNIVYFNVSNNRNIASVADDGLTYQLGGNIYRASGDGAKTATLIVSGAAAPINGVFDYERWVTNTQVKHLVSANDEVEYYISPTSPTTATSGKAYGVCNGSLLAGQTGKAQLIVEVP